MCVPEVGRGPQVAEVAGIKIAVHRSLHVCGHLGLRQGRPQRKLTARENQRTVWLRQQKNQQMG